MSDFASGDLDMKAQLRAQLGSARRKQSGTAKGRKRAEKVAMSPHDGRLKRDITDTVQLNVAIRSEFKAWLSQASRDHRFTYVELVERGLELVRAELEKGGARG